MAFVRAFEDNEENPPEPPIPQPFNWPAGTPHLLSLLQSGFGSRLSDLPEDISEYAGQLVLTATHFGTIFDKKWGLENAGVVSPPILLALLRSAFQSNSVWLQEVAFSQTARLSSITPDIAQRIRLTLILLRQNGRLRRERLSTQAHLARLDRSNDFLSVFHLLQFISPIDFSIHIIFLLSVIVPLSIISWLPPSNFGILSIVIIVNILSFAATSSRFNSFSNRSSIFLSWLTITIMKGIITVCSAGYMFYFIAISAMDILGIRPSEPSFNPLMAYIFVMFSTWGWASIALLNSYLGQYTSPSWWLFLPITPIFYLKKLTIEVFIFLKKLSKSNALDIALLMTTLVILGFLMRFLSTLTVLLSTQIVGSNFLITDNNLRLIAGLLVATFIYSSVRIQQTNTTSTPKSIWVMSLISTLLTIMGSLLIFILLEPLLIFAISVIAIFLLPSLIISIVVTIRDFIRWRIWRNNLIELTEREFLDNLGQHHTRYFAIKFTKTVREQNLLVVNTNKQEERLLEKLIIAYEINGSNNEIPSSFESFFEKWLATFTSKNNNHLYKFGPEFFDEIYRLIEQTQTIQKQSTPLAP